MSFIKTNEVTKVYNPDKVPVHALRGISLEFKEGEFTAIVGPSGSGKTTYLNMIGGLDTPTSGSVEVADHNITEMSPKELTDFRLRNIGFVFQSYNLIPVLTAIENVAFIMMLQGVEKKEMNERAKKILESVGLGDRLHARPSELSGGQQQRVAVARALAAGPRFVMADEPTANLDSNSAATLLDIMQHLNEEEVVTFLFSTHDHRVIERARRIVTLEDGAVHSDILQEPVSIAAKNEG